MKARELNETRTNNLEWLNPKGYQGEYSQEAYFILDPIIGEIASEPNAEFPYGELSWFDIMVDKDGAEYAVFGEDNMNTDSTAYYVEV